MYGVAGAAVAVAGAPIVLGLLGFSSAGVVAGSIAAGVQSMIGNVAAGSIFAALQSAGAVGLAGTTKVAVAAIAAAVAWLLWL